MKYTTSIQGPSYVEGMEEVQPNADAPMRMITVDTAKLQLHKQKILDLTNDVPIGHADVENWSYEELVCWSVSACASVYCPRDTGCDCGACPRF